MTAKPISQADFDKLMKVMGMTGSSADGEALAAIRTANRLLASHKLTWQDVFARLVTVMPEPIAARPEPMRKTDSDYIEECFDIVRPTLRSGSTFEELINSLEEQWEKRGWLSPRQREVLFKARERAEAWRK